MEKTSKQGVMWLNQSGPKNLHNCPRDLSINDLVMLLFVPINIILHCVEYTYYMTGLILIKNNKCISLLKIYAKKLPRLILNVNIAEEIKIS